LNQNFCLSSIPFLT